MDSDLWKVERRDGILATFYSDIYIFIFGGWI
jgi:hypothetical protein